MVPLPEVTLPGLARIHNFGEWETKPRRNMLKYNMTKFL